MLIQGAASAQAPVFGSVEVVVAGDS
jgi:hypothetical protein